MLDKDKSFSGSLVLDMRIWCRYVNTLYKVKCKLRTELTVEPALTATFFVSMSINSVLLVDSLNYAFEYGELSNSQKKSYYNLNWKKKGRIKDW